LLEKPINDMFCILTSICVAGTGKFNPLKPSPRHMTEQIKLSGKG
jgi:hypothetical protein